MFSRAAVGSDECTCPGRPKLVDLESVGGRAVAVVIETPFPSMRQVAKTLGVPAERAKEIERLVEKRYKAGPGDRVLNRWSGNKRGSARSRGGRRS